MPLVTPGHYGMVCAEGPDFENPPFDGLVGHVCVPTPGDLDEWAGIVAQDLEHDGGYSGWTPWRSVVVQWHVPGTMAGRGADSDRYYHLAGDGGNRFLLIIKVRAMQLLR